MSTTSETRSTGDLASDALDLGRMRRDRTRKLREEMALCDVDALLLLGRANVQYSSGAALPFEDASHHQHLPTIALLIGDDTAPHLFTPHLDASPPDLPDDHVHEALHPELEHGVVQMADALQRLLGVHARVKLGIDEMTAAMRSGLGRLLRGATFSDANPITAAARLRKTPDEIECIRRAQHVNELAMHDVQAALRPGLRQCDLSAIFLGRIFELGATANVVNPIWEIVPRSLADGPYTLTGEVAFPVVSTDRRLEAGDVIWVDTGIAYEGYASDFGRTWIVGKELRPDARQRHQFERWRDIVEGVLSVTRPGATGSDLTRAALRAVGGPGSSIGADVARPWLGHLYLGHGIGLDSAEMPLIGTDLGEDFDRSIVLAPGMIVVLEPVVWDDGHGGYRGEEVIVVTDTGYRRLGEYSYEPFA